MTARAGMIGLQLDGGVGQRTAALVAVGQDILDVIDPGLETPGGICRGARPRGDPRPHRPRRPARARRRPQARPWNGSDGRASFCWFGRLRRSARRRRSAGRGDKTDRGQRPESGPAEGAGAVSPASVFRRVWTKVLAIRLLTVYVTDRYLRGVTGQYRLAHVIRLCHRINVTGKVRSLILGISSRGRLFLPR